MYARAIGFFPLWVVLLFGACSSSDEEPAADPDGGMDGGQISGADSGGSDGSAGGGGSDGGTTVVDGGGPGPVCGDGVVEGAEQCDDGNDVEDDGCTSLCEKTCEEDPDCDDLNPCNGLERCSAEGICGPGDGAKSDGEQCGDNASCYEGECLEHKCGNGVVQADEECDDGNGDDFDGCTQQCRFTCVSEDPDRDCGNDCDLEAVCDDEAHICTAGNPLPDGTLCNRERGYCLDGVCVPSTCGDGVVEPNEECDEGEQNGVAGSGCSTKCTLGYCGDGVIEGKEHCDDGSWCLGSDDEALNGTECTDDSGPCVAANGMCGPTNLDGCDFACKLEFVLRGTSVNVSPDPAPDFCAHAGSDKEGNAFAGLFPDPTLIDLANEYISGQLASGEALVLFHVMDVEDYTGTTPDPLIKLGMSTGAPDGDWTAMATMLDAPTLVYREFYDDHLEPLSVSNAELILDNGTLVSETSLPYTAGFASDEGDFILHDIAIRIAVDPPRSIMTPPPESAPGLEIPETVGMQTPGILCGAFAADAFARMGLPQADLLGLPVAFSDFCVDQGGLLTYTSCAEGQDPPDCSSVLDLLQGGCSALGVWFVRPIGDPDADTDGDGENDAYSMVLSVSAERIKITGFAEGDPPFVPIAL